MVDTKDQTPSPINTMLYFLFLTIFYAIIYVYTISNSQDISNVFKNSKNTIINLIYSLLLLSGLFFLNLKTSKQICPGSEKFQYYNVLVYTIIPWLLIYGILYVLLDIFPGWSKPFSNTLGYIFVNTIGAEILLDNFLKENKDNNENTNLVNAIAKIGNNKSMFINQFSHNDNEFMEFFNELKVSKIFKEQIDEDDITDFFKLITIKHIIGKLIWYILAGTLIASISFNYLIQMRCDNDIDKINQTIDEFYDKNKLTPDGSYWKVLKGSKPDTVKVPLYDGVDGSKGRLEFKKYSGKYHGLVQHLNNVILREGSELEDRGDYTLTNDALRDTKILQHKDINLNDYIKITENNEDYYFIAEPNPADE